MKESSIKFSWISNIISKNLILSTVNLVSSPLYTVIYRVYKCSVRVLCKIDLFKRVILLYFSLTLSIISVCENDL